MGNVTVHALRGLSINIKEGEFVSITGPSGSGKSTAMHIIGCLDLPTRGKVYLKGKDITQYSESELAVIRGRTIGFIFQMFNLISTATALENVMLPLLFRGVPLSERKERAKKLLTDLGLGRRLHHKPTELSGGEQQRIAIARALITNPDIILADEPTGNLDTKTGNVIMDVLKKAYENDGKTMIIVTHDWYIAKRASRIIKIRDGKVVK